MTKVMRCRDAGFDCEVVIRAENEEQVLKLAVQHAKAVHDIHKITPELDEKFLNVIHDE